jgi:hypothetical protein
MSKVSSRGYSGIVPRLTSYRFGIAFGNKRSGYRKETGRSKLARQLWSAYHYARSLIYLNAMPVSATFRRLAQAAAAALLLSCGTVAFALQHKPPGIGHPGAQPRSVQAPAPRVAQVPAARPVQPPAQGPGPGRNQEHLAQWMQRHSNLPLAEQQRALEKEPGFRDLPPETQQRMRDRLTQLNNMSPEQRSRLLERNEVMEHLTPPERQQVRGAMQQLGALPDDRRRLVARAFRDLREMPQQQRQVILNSDRFRGQFSEQERSTLTNLLAVEPYLPVQHPNANDAPVPGK